MLCLWGGAFIPGDENKRKVFDHCHWPGNYRSAMHSECNMQCREAKTFPVFFHNLSKYDGNFLIRALNAFDDGPVTILPRNEETFISIRKEFVLYKESLPDGKTRDRKVSFEFKDSYLFIPQSLWEAAKRLADEDYLPMKRYGPHYGLLKGKQVFPYASLNSVKSMSRTDLIPKVTGVKFLRKNLFEP